MIVAVCVLRRLRKNRRRRRRRPRRSTLRIVTSRAVPQSPRGHDPEGPSQVQLSIAFPFLGTRVKRAS